MPVSDLGPCLLVTGLAEVALLIAEVINQQNRISWLDGYHRPAVCKHVAA